MCYVYTSLVVSICSPPNDVMTIHVYMIRHSFPNQKQQAISEFSKKWKLEKIMMEIGKKNNDYWSLKKRILKREHLFFVKRKTCKTEKNQKLLFFCQENNKKTDLFSQISFHFFTTYIAHVIIGPEI